ncbi:CdaR family protein [Clostridium sp.]|uniref:CdaR family protein n=1 Tax=Clostridium sp. TaxID=1506 RepID=UPI002FC8077C
MDNQKRQDILIKVCCVIASLALWVYIRTSENPVINQTIRYVPITVVNEEVLSETGLTLVPNQEFTVSLTIKGPSSVIDNIDKNKDFNLEADLGKYALKSGENWIPVEIKQAPSNVTILNQEGVSTKVNLDSLVSKDVSVIPNMVGTTAEGFHAENPTISSQIVVVSGGKTYIDKVANIVANIDITNANVDINKTIQLKAVDAEGKEVQNVKVSPEYAQVNVSIKKGKEVDIEAVTTGGTTTGASVESIEIIPRKIEVIGNNDIIDQLNSISTEPIDLSKVSGDTTIEVKLKLPQGVTLVKPDTVVKVKLTLKKPSQKTFKITIKTKNSGTDLAATLDKTTVDVVLSAMETELNKITETTLVATVDLNGLSEGDHNVPLVISGIPGNVQKVSQSVTEVKVSIKKTAEVINDNVN